MKIKTSLLFKLIEMGELKGFMGVRELSRPSVCDTEQRASDCALEHRRRRGKGGTKSGEGAQERTGKSGGRKEAAGGSPSRKHIGDSGLKKSE